MDDADKGQQEARTVIAAALIETERLLIEVTKKVERFDANICALQGSLEQAPKVLHSVRVNNFVPNVGFGVVDDLMGILSKEPFIGLQLVSVEG